MTLHDLKLVGNVFIQHQHYTATGLQLTVCHAGIVEEAVRTAIKATVTSVFQSQQHMYTAVKLGESQVMLWYCAHSVSLKSVAGHMYAFCSDVIHFLLRCVAVAHACTGSHVCLLLLLHQEHDSIPCSQSRGLQASSIVLPCSGCQEHSAAPLSALHLSTELLTKIVSIIITNC